MINDHRDNDDDDDEKLKPKNDYSKFQNARILAVSSGIAW